MRTRDGGRSWVGIPAPAAELSTGPSTGVREIRFADADNGWAFGPDLWATHDGGAHWARVSLPGVEAGAEVSDLAAAAGVVHAAVLGGVVHVLTSPVGTDAWEASATTVPIGGGPVPRAQLVLQGSAGWLIELDRVVVGGARLSGGSWAPWQPPCIDAAGPAFLAASTPADLVAVCDEGQWSGGPRSVQFYVSTDAGTSFHQTTTLTLQYAGAVASGLPGTAVVAGNLENGTMELFATFDGGFRWVSVYEGSGSLRDLGFTTRSQGVVVAGSASTGAGNLLMTVDGGHNWNVVAFR